MANSDKEGIIRAVFEAYLRRDRAVIENAFTTDFTFTSPYDDHIDKAAYFERCWPNSTQIRSIDVYFGASYKNGALEKKT